MLRSSELLLLSSGLACCLAELVITVSRGGPDANVFKQSVRGNVSADTVTITYVAPDGGGVRQVTDIKNAVTVTVVTIPGEEELGQPAYQVVSFVSFGGLFSCLHFADFYVIWWIFYFILFLFCRWCVSCRPTPAT